jgi:hypothetical protein
MKNIFRLSGLLVAVLFFSSCSKNNLSDSGFQKERLIKLSAELEQNYSSPPIASSSAPESMQLSPIQATNEGEKVHSSIEKELSGKTNPVKTFNAIKNAKKVIKGYKKIKPEEINNIKGNNKLNLSPNMKKGLILIIIGLLVSILWWLSPLFGLIAGILVIAGLVFILIDLLEL